MTMHNLCMTVHNVVGTSCEAGWTSGHLAPTSLEELLPMPDSNLPDNDVFDSAFYNQYIREQVIVTCTSTTRPTGVEGRVIYETDNDKLMIYDGAAWSPIGSSKWTTATPSWTGLTIGNGTDSMQYRFASGFLEVRGTLDFGSTTTVDGEVVLTHPASVSATGTGSVLYSPVGLATYHDVGTAVRSGVVIWNNATSVLMRVYQTDGTFAGPTTLSSTVPFTWTTNDQLLYQYRVGIA